MILIYPLLAFILTFLLGRFVGRQLAIISCLFLSILSFITSLYYSYQVFFEGNTYSIVIDSWINIGAIQISYKLLLDPLSVTFTTLIAFITFLILIYSYDYLYEDPHLVKFFSYLSFFSFAMSTLVLAGNFIMMFLGWETVGLASYLLINFWSTRNQANQAALKAIAFNRIGDCFFLLSISLMFYICGSFDLEDITALIPLQSNKTITLFSQVINLNELFGLSLFLAAAAKSAQLFLHAWLPAAMEGPTSVSALLHSATMVTAGIFLVLRSSIVFTYAPIVSILITSIGLITANISSLTGLYQYDIKRIIAFSTCSQLGFMLFVAGMGNYSYSIFHLYNHAFFKALLFLCAGSIIHAVGDQDIRRMGALFKTLPITYNAMLLGSLSLLGFPFLSGFYSKDFALEVIYNIYGNFAYIIYIVSTISASLTAFYTTRLLYYVFFHTVNEPRSILKNVKESSFFLYIPICVLTIFSIFSGFLFKDLFTLNCSYNFVEPIISNSNIDQDYFKDLNKILPTIYGIFGIICLYFVCIKTKGYQKIYIRGILFAYLLICQLFIDALNNWTISSRITNTALNITYKTIDQGFLELIAASGIHNFIEKTVKHIYTEPSDIYPMVLTSIWILAILSSLFITQNYSTALALFLLLIIIYLNNNGLFMSCTGFCLYSPEESSILLSFVETIDTSILPIGIILGGMTSCYLIYKGKYLYNKKSNPEESLPHLIIFTIGFLTGIYVIIKIAMWIVNLSEDNPLASITSPMNNPLNISTIIHNSIDIQPYIFTLTNPFELLFPYTSLVITITFIIVITSCYLLYKILFYCYNKKNINSINHKPSTTNRSDNNNYPPIKDGLNTLLFKMYSTWLYLFLTRLFFITKHTYSYYALKFHLLYKYLEINKIDFSKEDEAKYLFIKCYDIEYVNEFRTNPFPEFDIVHNRAIIRYFVIKTVKYDYYLNISLYNDWGRKIYITNFSNLTLEEFNIMLKEAYTRINNEKK